MSAMPARSPGLPERLAAKAFALSIDPSVSPESAGAALVRMAGSRTAALAWARRRVESRLVDHPTRLGESAALALRAALSSTTSAEENNGPDDSDGPSAPSGHCDPPRADTGYAR